MRNKKMGYLCLGFIFTYMLIIMSIQGMIITINTIYSQQSLRSSFGQVVSNELLEFSRVLEENDINAFAFSNAPYLQSMKNDYLSISLIPTNTSNVKNFGGFDIKGKVFTEADIEKGEKKVIIPEHLLKYCESRSNKNYFYIDSLDNDFEVIGTIQNKGAFKDILIPYKNLNSITNDEYTFMISNPVNDTLKDGSQIATQIEPSLGELIKSNIRGQKNMLINMILGILLATCSMILFVNLWISDNKEMFKIFRILGGGNKYIFAYIFKRISLVSAIAMGITIISGTFIESINGIVKQETAFILILICIIFSIILSLTVVLISLKNTFLFIKDERR
ncbi:MAG: hypothetical protein ACRCTZ_06410 [Sarcina sp.]